MRFRLSCLKFDDEGSAKIFGLELARLFVDCCYRDLVIPLSALRDREATNTTKVELVVKVVQASTLWAESRLPPPLSWIDSRRVAGFICSAYARINFRQRLGALKDFTNFGLPSTDVAMSYRRADRATRFLRHEFLRPERRTIRGHCVKSLD